MEQRNASDYSNYEFNLGFSTPKPTDSIAPDNKLDIPSIPLSGQETLNNDEILHTLRHFHLGDPSSIEKTETVSDDYAPALLHSYRDASKVRYNYPLFLDINGEAKPISTFMHESVDDNARILKDNLSRIERYLRDTLKETEGPILASSLLIEAGKAVQLEINLDEENNSRFEADFNQLLADIEPNAQLLGYGQYAAIHLLNHAIRHTLIPRRANFNETLKKHILSLKTLLDINWRQTDESIEPKMALDSVGYASSRFDPLALSDVMDHSRGSVSMTKERHQRIETALQILEEYLQHDDPILIKCVNLGGLTGDWLKNTPDFEEISDPEPCARATALFDQQTAIFAKVFSAARIAQLEINNIYDPAIHDPWFAHFSWEAFSKEEMLLLPVVIALESAERVAGSAMNALSRLLSSGRPVHVLVRLRAHANPYSSSDEDPFLNYRLELSYFGISHRQAVISQSSSARHQHLLKQFYSALEATRTSLHIINTGVQHSAHGINAWLVSGAALESRAHPFFHINPEAGDSFADRMDFIGNPQPELDWSLHPFKYKNQTGEIISTELAFTFADYALLVPRIHQHFRLVPVDYDSDYLTPVDVYLSDCNNKEDCKRVPFIWATNEKSELRKLVVSRALILACKDRLNYWHSLQEMAGIQNKYVDQAVQKERETLQAEAQTERERLQTEHSEQLEQVRQQTASEVMQRLTNVLLNIDLTTSTPLAQIKKTTSPAPVVSTKQVEKTKQEEIEEIEEEGCEDAWINSPLCTSCNDCIKINELLFLYNEDKQAFIGDINSGTYAQMVEAAEICPSHCIHPGKPVNLKEPGLDELIKRAEPFNNY